MPTALRKSFALKLKADQEGGFKARIATLNVVDKDKDVSLPGSFPDGKRVLISAYMHASWYGEMPVGDGVIGSSDSEAWIEGKFWLDTEAGKQTYLMVKNAGELQEWSYGYDLLRVSTEKADLEEFPGALQVIQKQDVFEASPVLIGAGVNTGTEYIKSAKTLLTGGLQAKAHALATGLKSATLEPTTLATIAQIDLLADELDELVDTLMDDLGIPDPDEIADGEVEEPKSFAPDAHLKFALAAVRGFLQRVMVRAAMRAKDGRDLSAPNRERVTALKTGLAEALADADNLLASVEPPPAEGADELESLWLENEQLGASLPTLLGQI